jgi:hypothetical protein
MVSVSQVVIANSEDVKLTSNKPTRGSMASLSAMLGVIDDYEAKQKQLWQNVHESVKNKTVPSELPDDAVLFVSENMFVKLPSQLKEGLSGKLFASIILTDDQMVIMKRKDLPPMHNRSESQYD